MSGDGYFNTGCRTDRLGSNGHDERGLDPSPKYLADGSRHRDCGFAGPDDRHAPDPAQIIGAVCCLEPVFVKSEDSAHGLGGIGCVQCRLEDAAHISPNG